MNVNTSPRGSCCSSCAHEDDSKQSSKQSSNGTWGANMLHVHEESSLASITNGANILMEAISSGAWDLTIDIIRQSPSEVSKWEVVTVEGSRVRLLPLHYACTRNPPVHVIHALIEAAPDTLSYADQNGRTLLHWAIDNGNVSPEILEKILHLHPNNAKRREDKYGCLPLHNACHNKNGKKRKHITNGDQLTIVQLLLDTFPEAVSSRDGHWGWLPLHIATRTGAPFEVIVALLEACPSAAAVGDKFLRLPIHYATRYSHNWDEEEAQRIIGTLCEFFPAGLKRREKKSGHTPLATACSIPSPQKNIISTLLLHCPEAASIPDLNLALPLHAAARANIGSWLVDALLLANCTGAQEGDYNGMLPLHWACMNSSFTVVEKLINAFPSGTSKMEIHDNFLPIHLAIKHGADEDVILSLLFHYPNGARAKDASGALPIHLACENSANVALRSLKLLIIAHPEGSDAKDSHGRRPNDYAKMSNDEGTASAFLDVLENYSINEIGTDETKPLEDPNTRLPCTGPDVARFPSISTLSDENSLEGEAEDQHPHTPLQTLKEENILEDEQADASENTSSLPLLPTLEGRTKSPEHMGARNNTLHRHYDLPFNSSARARYATAGGGRFGSRFRGKAVQATYPMQRSETADCGRDDVTVSTQASYFIAHDENGDARILRGC